MPNTITAVSPLSPRWQVVAQPKTRASLSHIQATYQAHHTLLQYNGAAHCHLVQQLIFLLLKELPVVTETER